MDDIDVVAVVREEIWEQFVEHVVENQVDTYGILSSERFSIACELLGFSEDEMDECSGDGWYNLDIFLFPVDWLTSLDELQGRIPHSDDRFMRNIATDARRFYPQTGKPAEAAGLPAYMQHE